MNLEDVQAVIDSAKARGTGSLERFVRHRLPNAQEREVREAVDVSLEIIESVPLFLARAKQEAGERRMDSAVRPILEYAARYFLHPVDVIPEMTHGLAGLLDDAYLVLRILQQLDGGPEPFLDWELDEPTRFLRVLMGERFGQKLDSLSEEAMAEISDHVSQVWQQVTHEA